MARLEAAYESARHGALEEAATVLAARLGDIGADAGFVATISADGRIVEVARVTPFSNVPVRLAFPVDAPYPLAASIRRDERIFISSNHTLACDHPGLVRIRGEDHACATFPLHDSAGSVIGSANLSFEDPREFSEGERRKIEELFVACEAALLRGRRMT